MGAIYIKVDMRLMHDVLYNLT